MNYKVLIVIIVLSLCFLIGFKKISNYKNNTNNSNIGELKILKYLPKNNNLLFISNFQSSNISNNIKNFSQNNQDEIKTLINNILAYLGLDIGKNQLRDIYNNEIIISTYENKQNSKDDILIVFKIKPEKELNDILNLPDKIIETDQLIKIYRENKINYLNFIYRTNDDYIIASSNKKLVLDSINLNNFEKTDFSSELLSKFNSENNILLTKVFKNNLYLNDAIYPLNKDKNIITTFALKDKSLISNSYLVNNIKNLNFDSYKELSNKRLQDNNNNYQIYIYDDLTNFLEYLNPLIDNFEKSILEQFNQNGFLIISDKKWVIVYENDAKHKIDNIEKFKDYKKYSMKKNGYIFSLYSKDILKEEENVIKKVSYNDIFLIQSDELFLISNNLINDKKIDIIKKKFLKFKDSGANTFFYKEIDLKDLDSYKNKFFTYFDNLNLIFKNKINLANSEFKAISKQSIPEISPLLYAETILNIS